MSRRPSGHSTRAVHAGERQETPRQGVAVPIHQTAPYRFDSAAELAGAMEAPGQEAIYSRNANPSVRAVEEKIAALEGAEDARAFASGMAAIAATLSTVLASGDGLLCSTDVYGGTSAWLDWLTRRHPEVPVERSSLADLPARLEGGVPEGIRAVFVETPANPLLGCCDLERVAAACRPRGLTLVVDNTFATPILQRPLELGASVVLHSATKFLAGHSDVTAGLVAGDAETVARFDETRRLGGGVLDPHAAFLVGRGMKTLALRMERHSANAARLAELLAGHPAVERVHYPGRDPIGSRQMSAGGGMVSFVVRGGWPAASRVMDRLEVFAIIPSLGGVESGVSSPAITSHRHLTAQERAAAGIDEGLLRLSVGIEDGDDLAADLERALDGV
ncbi:MAG: PLP-dependent aspartate aminotransferase family protein [Thermoanaerobaculia bacterium]